MRRFLFDPHIRLAFVSGVYTLFLLLILPRIPIRLDNKFLKVDSFIGGYQFNLLGKDLDFSTFRKTAEFGGGYKLSFKVPAEGESKTREVINRRLNILGIPDYSIFTRTEDGYTTIDLIMPFVKNERPVESFLNQRSFLTFRELLKEADWKEENAEEFFYNPSYWIDTGLDSNQILGVTLLRATTQDTSAQFQINLTPEGRRMFSEVVKRNIGRPIALYMDDSTLPISMPLLGEDLADVTDIDPVVTSNLDIKNTKLFVDHVNSGHYPFGYEYLGKEEVQATYKGFSTRLFAVSALLGFIAAFLFTFLTYRKLSFAFLLSLLVQFITMLFLLKIFSVYIGMKVVLIVSLCVSIYLAFGVLLLSQMKEHAGDMSLLGVYMKEAFRNSVSLVKPFLLVVAFGVTLFYLVGGEQSFTLLKVLIIGYLSSYVAFIVFKLFAGLFWPRKGKRK